MRWLVEDIWNGLWKIKCPPKVQNFLWRLGHNSHPMNMNIARRGIDLDTRCNICHRLFEDGGHIMFKCKFVKPVWAALMLEDTSLELSECTSPLDVILKVLSYPQEKQLLTVTCLWSWWSERNKTTHGEKRLNVDELQFPVRNQIGRAHV